MYRTQSGETRFLQQLVETVTWCRPRVAVHDPQHCLRSTELMPDLAANDSTPNAVYVDPQMVTSVAARRRQLLGVAQNGGRRPAPFFGGGRLLLSAPDYTIMDGIAAWETNDYLDEHDVAPWDTWIGTVMGLASHGPFGTWGSLWPSRIARFLKIARLTETLLVAWVPPDFVQLVSAGMSVESVGMLTWADDPNGRKCGPEYERITPRWLVRLAASLYSSSERSQP